MNCQQCDSDRIAHIHGHSKDLATIEYQSNERDGYLPNMDNLCGGDDIGIVVCLQCGQLQGKWPIADPTVEVECYSCEAYDLEVSLSDDTCPECGEELYKPDVRSVEPMEHGGDCTAPVPSNRCRLLVPIEIEHLNFIRPIGHELIVWKESDTHATAEILGQRVDLEKGIDVEMVDG